VTRGWRKLHNEELRDFYSSLSIIRMIKLRRQSMYHEWGRRGTHIGGKARRKETTEKTKIGGWIIL
jgi:hypothetical protein